MLLDQIGVHVQCGKNPLFEERYSKNHRPPANTKCEALKIYRLGEPLDMMERKNKRTPEHYLAALFSLCAVHVLLLKAVGGGSGRKHKRSPT